MKSKIKSIIIFVVIGIAMVSVYNVFIKKAPREPNLTTTSSTATPGVSTTAATTTNGAVANDANSQLSKDFLSVLLSIKNIALDDSIFTDLAFRNLKDSTILLSPDGSEGRPNPFAPIGTENNVIPASALSGFGDSELENDLLVNPTDSTETTTTTKPKTQKP